MTLATLVLALVTAQRLGELVLARRNTRRLLAQGAYEVGAGHYPIVVALHAAWLGSLWLLAWDAPVDPSWLAVYIVLQALRLWVLASLGPRWTTRIIVLPGAPLARRGPYRFVSHPNYVVVAAEIAVLPLVFGLVWHAALFTLLNAAVLFIRIRAEGAALAQQRASALTMGVRRSGWDLGAAWGLTDGRDDPLDRQPFRLGPGAPRGLDRPRRVA